MSLTEMAIKFGLPMAGALLAALAARALHFGARKLRAEAEAAEDGSMRERLFQLAGLLAECMADGVVSVENTIRPEIKAASADGKISAEDAAKLRAAAVAAALAQAKVIAPQLVEEAGLGQVQAMLESMVEPAAARLAGDSRAAQGPR